MVFCMTAGFFENIFATKWTKNKICWISEKFRQYFLTLSYNESLFCLLYAWTNPIFGRKSGSWDMGQNALGQLDCRILKSTISLEQCDEKVWFFACWYKFIKTKSWLKYIGGGHDQKWVSPLWGHRTLTLAVS